MNCRCCAKVSLESYSSSSSITLPSSLEVICNGSLSYLPSLKELTIPSGTQNGEKMRLRGKGIENVNSKRKGDMYVITKIIIPDSVTSLETSFQITTCPFLRRIRKLYLRLH